MNLKNENVPLARIGKDGKSIRCGAGVTTDATGAQRYTCGGELGARWYEEDTRDDDPRWWSFGHGFYLPKEFGLDANGDFYRVTKRPHYRTEGLEGGVAIVSAKQAGAPRVRPKPIKRIDRQCSDWGDAGTFVLPVRVLCPECKRLNLITESLIESDAKKLAA